MSYKPNMKKTEQLLFRRRPSSIDLFIAPKGRRLTIIFTLEKLYVTGRENADD